MSYRELRAHFFRASSQNAFLNLSSAPGREGSTLDPDVMSESSPCDSSASEPIRTGYPRRIRLENNYT